MKAIYLSAILNGIATTMLGSLMPGFETRFDLEDAQGGLLFVAQFLMSLLSAAATAKLTRRFGYWRVVAGGMVVAAAGVLGCAGRTWTVTIVSVAVYGAGLGVVTPTSNVGVAAAAKSDSARRVIWLNLFWSMGAMAAPTLVATLRGHFLTALSAAFLVVAAVLVLNDSGDRPAPEPAALARRRVPHLIFALMLFLYVGAELSTAGWVSSYATRSAATRNLWAVLPSVFWGSILLGRLIAPYLLQRVTSAVLARCSLGIALLGALLLVAGDGPLMLLAGSSLSGLGMAPIFPVVVAAYADRAGASASGLVFSAAGLGGAGVPWLVGLVSTATGSLRMGLITVSALIVAMFGILWTGLLVPQRHNRIDLRGTPSRDEHS